MEGHMDQAELKLATGSLALDGVTTSEDDLLDMISSLEARLGDVRELHREHQGLESELDELRNELEARQCDLDEREQLLRESSTEVRSERRHIEEERREILAEQEAIERRRAELEAKEHEVAARFSSVDDMRAKLEAAEAALKAEREKREKEAEAFRREQAELAKREEELAAHAATAGDQSQEIKDLAAQLAEAHKIAMARTLEAEKRAGEANQRALDMERRCRELAGECDVVRRELQGSREQVRKLELELPKRIYQHQTRLERGDRVRRGIATGATWICVAFTMAAAGMFGFQGAAAQAALMLGLAFAAYFYGSQAIAGRLLDPPAIVIGLIGATFGLWFPMWTNAVTQALTTWSLPTGGLPDAVASQLPLAVSVATAGLTMTVGVFALTWSGGLLFQVGAVSLLAGGLAMFPDTSGFALGAAALLWSAVTGAGLARWAARNTPGIARVAVPFPQVEAGAPPIGRAI
ncbi:MAG: hypothetical protein IPJ41_04835 [Phycisphaerales bacterium]|nr:hypothetical protein [Phycisphaerales bacterium]